MNRLLTCQGKDAYSILGLRSDATDEEIKRYYRRQAVLVHPDKVLCYIRMLFQRCDCPKIQYWSALLLTNDIFFSTHFLACYSKVAMLSATWCSENRE